MTNLVISELLTKAQVDDVQRLIDLGQLEAANALHAAYVQLQNTLGVGGIKQRPHKKTGEPMLYVSFPRGQGRRFGFTMFKSEAQYILENIEKFRAVANALPDRILKAS